MAQHILLGEMSTAPSILEKFEISSPVISKGLKVVAWIASLSVSSTLPSVITRSAPLFFAMVASMRDQSFCFSQFSSSGNTLSTLFINTFFSEMIFSK